MSESELEALRRTVAELLAKKDKQKARIAELETSLTESQSKLTASEQKVHELTIGVPLRILSEGLSSVPELFQQELLKNFSVTMIDDKLTFQTLEGKPVIGKNGPVEFEQGALRDFLASDLCSHSKVFNHLIVATKASGAAGVPQQQQQHKPQATGQSFGLR